MSTQSQLRIATRDDIPALRSLIEISIRSLQKNDYTQAQIEGSIGHVLGLDTQLIEDQTYFLAETPGPDRTLAGCGGWSMRGTPFGSDHGPERSNNILNHATDHARIRAIFVHPRFVRQGLGTLLLHHSEAQAQASGFTRFQMGSTLTGRALYLLRGYKEHAQIEVPLPNGEVLPILHMTRELPTAEFSTPVFILKS